MRVGNDARTSDSTGHRHAARDVSRGGCEDRPSDAAGESLASRARGSEIALPGVPGGGLWHRS